MHYQLKGLRKGRGCLIIGEVAQAHDGSLGTAHAYVDAIAEAGADAVKFQTHIASAESTPSEPWRVRFSPQDLTRYEYWQRMEFTEAQWSGLKEHADDRGLVFISSPFSVEAVELLSRVGVGAWKVASGEVNTRPMFDAMAKTRRPFIVSTGMSTYAEIATAVGRVEEAELPLVLLQCTSSYPTPPEKLGLNVLAEFRERYQCGVGLSDHSGTIYPSLAAVTLGAEVIEVHVTMSRELFGPDVKASVTTSELADLVRGVRCIETSFANPVDKDVVAKELEPLRAAFFKSVVARHDLDVGTVLADEHLALRKPGSGLSPERLDDVLGRVLCRAVPANAPLCEADLGV